MGHNHHHHTGHNHSHHGAGNLRMAFFLNLGFTIIEIIGGIWTNSMAILSDSIHDLGDSLSLGFSWYFEKKADQKGDSSYSFGYQRFSLLGALINGLVLVSGSALILINSIPRLLNPEPTNPHGMIGFALLGIAVNGFAAWKLEGGGSLNERMVKWHLLEDVLGWVAVLIVSIVLLFTDLYILDPLLSILILAWVMYNVMKNLNETIKVFLQGVPKEIDLQELEKQISGIPSVFSFHHARVWSLDGSKHVLSIHVVVKDVKEIHELILLKKRVREILRTHLVEHATVEIELGEEDCSMHFGS